MNKIMAFILKANQILFLVAILIIIGNLIQPLFSSFFKEGYAPPKIQIIDKDNGKNTDFELRHNIDFQQSVLDVFVFEISANAIETKQESTVLSMFDYGEKFQTVNLLFAPKSGASYNLMENNAYILDTSYYNLHESRQRKLSKNLYLIVSHDTNGDGFLSKKDTADLFVSDYNGKNMSIVLKDVKNFEIVQSDLLLIKKNLGINKIFYTYDVLANKLSKLDTKIMLTSQCTRTC